MTSAQNGGTAGFAGRRAVVFGGSGFMGSHLVHALAELGAAVLSFDREATTDLTQNVESCIGDITDRDAVAGAIGGADHIFCFAGGLGATRSIADPIADLRSSALAQLLLLEAARMRAPRASIVLAGTRLEYGSPRYLPVDEQHPLQPTSPYATNKMLAGIYYRMYAERFDMHAVELRLPNPYGPHAPGAPARHGYGILNLFIDLAKKGEPIKLYGDGEQRRDFVHVDDVVAATLHAALAPGAKGLAINVGSGVGTTLRSAAEMVVELCGTGSVITGEPWPEDYASVETGDFFFDISRAEAVLSWRPAIALRDGLGSLLGR